MDELRLCVKVWVDGELRVMVNRNGQQEWSTGTVRCGDLEGVTVAAGTFDGRRHLVFHRPTSTCTVNHNHLYITRMTLLQSKHQQLIASHLLPGFNAHDQLPDLPLVEYHCTVLHWWFNYKRMDGLKQRSNLKMNEMMT
jgi:hypothetical protein